MESNFERTDLYSWLSEDRMNLMNRLRALHSYEFTADQVEASRIDRWINTWQAELDATNVALAALKEHTERT